MRLARALPYVEEVTIFGNSLHLLVPEAVSDQAIQDDLAGGARDEVAIRPIVPSLEDVFVRLTGLQDDAPAQRGAPR
jgi:hypothetical protein